MQSDEGEVVLDGFSLSPEKLIQLSTGGRIVLCPKAAKRVEEARKFLMDVAAQRTVYGVNTGFGSFADRRIKESDLAQLQINLIRSHSVGVGDPIPLDQVRMILAIRINVLAKGHSGARLDTVQKMISAFNAGCLPRIPEQGSVGASDLCPLAHLALGLMGEGSMWDDKKCSWEPAKDVLESRKCSPIELEAKEGLALINGTQFITALTTQALHRAEMLLKQAHLVAATTHAALRGTPRGYDERIHAARGQAGQIDVARSLRAYTAWDVPPRPTTVTPLPEGQSGPRVMCLPEGKVQDAYTLRCIPQVHGVVSDSLDFCRSLLERELNAATDNPMIFVEHSGESVDEEWGDIISGGNFHAEYPAKAADFLSIAIAEVGNMSERRTYRMTTHALSKLPSFLIPPEEGGLNSGFMIVQYTAAAIASENKVLVHPAASDSIPTSEGQEDHVSMGAYAARKALQVVANVERIVAIELFTACQALDIAYSEEARVDCSALNPEEMLRPLPPAIRQVWRLVREKHGISVAKVDRFFAPDMDECINILRAGELLPIADAAVPQQS